MPGKKNVVADDSSLLNVSNLKIQEEEEALTSISGLENRNISYISNIKLTLHTALTFK
jgi:hypothetical protein